MSYIANQTGASAAYTYFNEDISNELTGNNFAFYQLELTLFP